MIELLIWLTGIILITAGIIAYFRNRDPFHPLVYFGPMLFYLYVFLPGYHLYTGTLDAFYSDVTVLEYPQTVILVFLTAFCVGCLWYRLPGDVEAYADRPLSISPEQAKYIRTAGLMLGVIGLLAYFYTLSVVGGVWEAYSKAKGGGASASGYISEAPLLTIPAVMLYAVARARKPLDWHSAALMFLMVSPHLMHGLLGARRGPAFLALAALFFGWYLAVARRPSLKLVMVWGITVGSLMLALVSHRSGIKLGSEFEWDKQKFADTFLSKEEHQYETTGMAWATIRASHYHDRFYYGRRYMTQILIRPIPRQLWPEKYSAMGLQWMSDAPGLGGFTINEWLDAVGYEPQMGSASGFVADSYMEFAWGGIVVCFLVGLMYSHLWRRALARGGLWSILYFEASVLSVYLPTQGLASAWLYRFLFIAVPTVFFWYSSMIVKRRMEGDTGRLLP